MRFELDHLRLNKPLDFCQDNGAVPAVHGRVSHAAIRFGTLQTKEPSYRTAAWVLVV